MTAHISSILALGHFNVVPILLLHIMYVLTFSNATNTFCTVHVPLCLVREVVNCDP